MQRRARAFGFTAGFTIAADLLLATAGPPAGAAGPIAQISDQFPPALELRAPDGTIVHRDGGAPAVLAYSGDGRALASAGRAAARDHAVRVWNARTGEEFTGALEQTLTGHAAPVVALAYRGSTSQILSVGSDGQVNLWDAAAGTLVHTARFTDAFDLAVVRPGASAGFATAAGAQITLRSGDTGQAMRSFGSADAQPRCLAFQPDGKLLVVGGQGGKIVVHDPDTGALVHSFTAGGPVRACAVSATHVAAVVLLRRGAAIELWPLDGPAEAPARRLAEGDGGHKVDQAAPTALVFSVKGDQLAGAGAGVGTGTAIEVWDVGSGARLTTNQGHTAPVLALAFNPNGQKLASGAADETLRLWTVPLPPLPPADAAKVAAATPHKATATPRRPRKLLVFWRADAILHKGGVPAANQAIAAMGRQTGAFRAFFSRDYQVFDPKILARYDAIVFNSTAHISLPDEAKQALLDYVKRGKGVVGIHAAIDMWRRWPEGAAIIGATFGGHPWHPTGTWSVKLEAPQHPLLAAFGGKGFKMHDEFYELDEPYRRADRRVLMSLDTADPVTANVTPLHRKDNDFAVAWVKRFGEGRIFYGMFGHLADPFFDPAVQQFYLDGIQFALGDLAADATPQPPPAASPAAPAAHARTATPAAAEATR